MRYWALLTPSMLALVLAGPVAAQDPPPTPPKPVVDRPGATDKVSPTPVVVTSEPRRTTESADRPAGLKSPSDDRIHSTRPPRFDDNMTNTGRRLSEYSRNIRKYDAALEMYRGSRREVRQNTDLQALIYRIQAEGAFDDRKRGDTDVPVDTMKIDTIKPPPPPRPRPTDPDLYWDLRLASLYGCASLNSFGYSDYYSRMSGRGMPQPFRSLRNSWNSYGYGGRFGNYGFGYGRFGYGLRYGYGYGSDVGRWYGFGDLGCGSAYGMGAFDPAFDSYYGMGNYTTGHTDKCAAVLVESFDQMENEFEVELPALNARSSELLARIINFKRWDQETVYLTDRNGIEREIQPGITKHTTVKHCLKR